MRYGCAPAPYGHASRADVLRAGANGEPVGCERVLDVERDRERIAGLRMKRVLEHDPVRLAFGEVPASPADEPVDRVAVLGLRQRQLMPTALELVGAMAQPVRPRDEQLPASRRAHRVDRVAVEDGEAPARVLAKPTAQLDDDRALVAERELELLARRRNHACPARGWSEPGLGRRRATAKDHAPRSTAIPAAAA